MFRSYFLVVVLLSSVGWVFPFLALPRLGLSAPGGAVVLAGEDVAEILGLSPYILVN